MAEHAAEQRFSSRWALLLSALGIAVGTGNIWRFPRIVAANGGDDGAGAFLIAWLVCLVVWSVPLIIAEYALGQRGRMGPIGTFARLSRGRWAWMGAFVAFVATAIMFYYAVVTGWCFYYVGQTVAGALPGNHEAAVAGWQAFQGSPWPVLLHALAMGLGALVCLRGVRSIERVTTVLIPLLLVIVVVALVRAVTLPGAGAGLAYLFTPDWADLGKPTLWLDALTQNAWDTGAGWGLILVYAAYMRPEHGVVRNGVLTGLGNNTVSILAGMTIFGTVFAVLGAQQSAPEVLAVMRDSGPAGTGLTFMWMPQLFAEMPLGRPLAALFFLGLSAAAFTSLISMIELAARCLVDFGVPRPRAVGLVALVGFALGVPSALNLTFFGNQDFVWGVALMISGAFVAALVVRYGPERLRREVADPADWRLPPVWDHFMRYVIPALALILLVWWGGQATTEGFVGEGGRWWDPLNPYSLMTCLVQWAVALGVFLAANRWMARRTEAVGQTAGVDVYPDPADDFGLPPSP